MMNDQSQSDLREAEPQARVLDELARLRRQERPRYYVDEDLERLIQAYEAGASALRTLARLSRQQETRNEKDQGAALLPADPSASLRSTEPLPNICGKCFQPFIGDEPRVGRSCESQQYHLRDCVAENVLPPGALFAVTRLNTVVMDVARGEATLGEYATAREALIRVCLEARNVTR